MNDYWRLKTKLLKKVSNKNIDEISKVVLNYGTYGTKVLGSGGGGFVLAVCDPKFHQNIQKNFTN